MIMIKVGIKDCIKEAPQFKQGILNSQFIIYLLSLKARLRSFYSLFDHSSITFLLGNKLIINVYNRIFILLNSMLRF